MPAELPLGEKLDWKQRHTHRGSGRAHLGYARHRIVAVAIVVATIFPCSSLGSPAKNAT